VRLGIKLESIGSYSEVYAALLLVETIEEEEVASVAGSRRESIEYRKSWSDISIDYYITIY